MSKERRRPMFPLPGEAKALLNQVCLVLGILLAAITSIFSGSPLGGYCPQDIFHVASVPNPGHLAVWMYATWAGSAALMILGIIKRPFGVVFLAVMALSLALLCLRLVSAMSIPE